MSRRAYTLLEVVVVSGLSAMLLGLAIASFLMLNRTSRMQKARIDARQQLRASMAAVRSQLQSAAYVYAGYQGLFGGQSYAVPATGTVPSHGDLLFALPETQESPGSPLLWKVCGLRVVPRTPVDPNNPNALDIVEESVENVGPASLDDPAQLKDQLPDLAPLSVTRFDAYVDPASYGVLIRPSPTSVLLQFTFKLRPTDVSGSYSYYQSEHFETEVLLRNQPPLTPSPML